MAPAIIREMYPVVATNASTLINFSSYDTNVLERNGVKAVLRYVDRAELYRLGRLNQDPNSGGDGLSPVITVFLAEMSNGRGGKVKIDLTQAVLIDAFSNVLKAYTIESFKEAHPASIEGIGGTLFLFGDSYVVSSSRKKGKVKKNLTKTPVLKPGEKLRSFIVFDQSSEFSPTLTVLIPAVEAFDGEKSVLKFDLKFKFLQRLKRRETP